MAGEEPIGRDGRRGYRLSGELCVGRLLPADLFRAIENTGTSNTVVAPTGFEPVFQCRRMFLPWNQRLVAHGPTMIGRGQKSRGKPQHDE